MDYTKYFEKFSSMEKADVKKRTFELAQTILDIGTEIGLEFKIVVYIPAVLAFISDGVADKEEVDFLNNLNIRLSLDQGYKTVEELNDYKSEYGNIKKTVDNFYVEIKKLLETRTVNALGGRTFEDLFIEYLSGICAINGKIEENEEYFIESFLNAKALPSDNSSDSTEVVDSYDGFDDYSSAPAPQVIKVGGSLYSDQYNKYFSVGAEIKIEGADVERLDIRVQLLDSSGFILESLDETIYRAAEGIFRFGKEYRIDCSPSNFKVIVGASERTRFDPEENPDRVFKVTGMRFTSNLRYDEYEYSLACMVENVGNSSPNAKTTVFVVFYDANDNIVGGAECDGNRLYLNQPDRYDASIDCKNVVSKTKTFRWSCDCYYSY